MILVCNPAIKNVLSQSGSLTRLAPSVCVNKLNIVLVVEWRTFHIYEELYSALVFFVMT